MDEGNFFCIPNSLVDDHLAALSGAALKVYLILRKHMNQKTGEAFPSYTTIARLGGIGRAGAARGLKELLESGLITSDPDASKSTYRFQNETSSTMRLVPKRNQTGSKMEPQLVPKWNPNKTKEQDVPNKTKGTPKVPYSPSFELFWDRWPSGGRKVDKAGAWRVWSRKGLDAQADVVMAGLDRWLASADWAKNDGDYIPLVVTWLNQDRWYAKPKAAGANGHRPGQPIPPRPVTDRVTTKGVNFSD